MAAAALAAGVALGAAAQINKCVDKDGKVTFQQRPCESAVAAPAAAAPSGGTADRPATGAPAAGPASRPQDKAEKVAREELPLSDEELNLRNHAYILGVKKWCDEQVPGYREANAAGFALWRANNAELVQKFEALPATRKEVEHGYTYMSERFTAADLAGRNRCPPYSAMAGAPRGAIAAVPVARNPAIGPTSPSPLPDRELLLRDIAFQIEMIDWCTEAFPGYKTEYGAAVDDWRTKNAAVVRQIETGSAFKDRREDGRLTMAERYAPGDRAAAATCKQFTVVLTSSRP